MSVIQRIQEKQKWVFGTIALALILFIVQDAVMSKGKGMFSNTSTLGAVNGQSIDRDEFEHKVSFYEQMNGAQRDQLIGQVWDFMVLQTAMQQQYDKLGLKVTDKELSDLLFGDNPPSWLQQAFTNPNTGVYDVNAARDQFSQMKKNANDPRVAQLYEGYLEPTIMQTLASKYQSMVSGAVYVPKWMSEKTVADNNAMAKISYVKVDYSTVSDSAIKVSDDEIAAYEKNHAKQFEQKEETRQISYVTFDAAPSKDDTAAVVNQLNQLKAEFVSTVDEKSFLTKNSSELPYYNSYISKKTIKQKVNDSLFNLSEGSTYGPYIDGNNYVLAKLVGKRVVPDSVKVRHILVATAQRDQQSGQMQRIRDDSTAKKRFDSAMVLIKAGVNFDSVCAKYSDDPGSKDQGGVIDYFPSGQMMEEFNDFAFSGKTGDTKEVQTAFGYHYIEILGQKGSDEGYKLAYLAKPIVASQETIDAANTAATQFAASSKTKDQFDANAKKLNKNQMPASDIKAADYSITGVGENRQMVKWVYESDPGTVSEPFEAGDKFVVAMVLAVNKPGLQSAYAARQSVEPILKNQKKAQQIINSKIKGTTLDEIARSSGSMVQTADSVSFQAFIIPNLGNEPKILGAAFNKQLQGKVSAPIAGGSGVFVVKGESIFATASLGANAAMLREQLESRLKSQAGNSINAIRVSSDVKDYRSDFY